MDRLERLREARLYLILAPDRPWPEQEAAVRLAVSGGVQIVQLRDKSLGRSEIGRRAARLARLARELGVLAVVNDHPGLARETGASGAHVGQGDLSAGEARRVLGDGLILGVSTHDLRQAREASRSGWADYLGVGPIFPTATKAASRAIGTEVLRGILARVALPVFALGGINATNLDRVLRAGCRRIAVSSAILDAVDALEAARELRARLEGGPSLR